MVKNKGGGKHKHRSRKDSRAPAIKPRLRSAKAAEESYAKVLKVFGHGMAEVICNDMVVRLLIIRKKFRGRNRRDNAVAIDTMVLVGLRTWEVRAAKKQQKVDLLCVYSGVGREDLEKLPGMNPRILPGAGEASNGSGAYDITDEPDHQDASLGRARTNVKIAAIPMPTLDTGDEDIDFDDI